MTGQTKTRCIAITRAAKPCKSWAIVGSNPPLCSAHAGRNVGAGAPRGNLNARKHGYYSHRFTTQELADLVAHAENDSLDDSEEQSRNDLAALGPLIFSGTRHVAQLLRDRRALSGEAADGIAGAISQALDELSVEWGIEL